MAAPSTVRQGMKRSRAAVSEPNRASESHERGTVAEQGRDLVLVGLELVERAFESGVLVTGILQFDRGKHQPVDEQHHIGPTAVLALDHRELVHREPIVGIDVGEIDQLGGVAAGAAFLAGNLDVQPSTR